MPHQLQVMFSGAQIIVVAIGLFYESIAGRRLHERDFDGGADFAELDNLFIGQEIIFKNHLQTAALGGHGIVDQPDVAGNVIPIAAEYLAAIGDHIDLGRAGQHGGLGFHDFDTGGAVAVWKSDHGTNFYIRPGQDPLGETDGIGFDADRGNVIGAGQFAAFPQVAIGQGRMQQRVVDHLRQIAHGRWIVHGGKSSGSRGICNRSSGSPPRANAAPPKFPNELP